MAHVLNRVVDENLITNGIGLSVGTDYKADIICVNKRLLAITFSRNSKVQKEGSRSSCYRKVQR